MANNKMNDAEFQALLKSVEQEITQALVGESQKLSKGWDDESKRSLWSHGTIVRVKQPEDSEEWHGKYLGPVHEWASMPDHHRVSRMTGGKFHVVDQKHIRGPKEPGDPKKKSELTKAGEEDLEGDEGSAPPYDDGGAPGGESPAASPPPAAEGSAEDPGASSAPPGGAPGEDSPGEAPGGDPAADGGDDLEALKAEYMQLGQEDPEALKAHYLACVEALQAVMGGGGDEGPPGGAPPPEGGPGGPPPGPGGPPPAMKMELGSIAPGKNTTAGTDRLGAVSPTQATAGTDRLAAVSVAKKAELPGPPNGEDPTKKSERDKEITDLKKGQELLLNAVDLLLGRPLRKAVTGVPATSNAPKTLSREEAKSVLSEKIKTGSLKKSDRERAIAFTVGNLNLQEIQDLLV